MTWEPRKFKLRHTKDLSYENNIIKAFPINVRTYVYKNVSFKDKIELFSLTVFMGGTLGNLFERINNGHVVDYIKLNFIDFPVFNAFDIMICLGVFLYVVFVLFDFKSLKEQTHDNN